ncbi:hypothetical protein TTHERM_000408981 (macronuclear) [Tetrahymena thermophila SB210]|uniref:Uncharacterized protein n=1 Tax=Tetrahymena thermophila (strain SB210) TaxID=312017 RepID=W7X750_TETTS|nr:hypothetical protein TTHERM_000408981 [Tetrahymena thermophila SB210]EWS73187.1 hypothetical protein TTHERM_000408981 [Tetrahymena thermophila SB210]|eukprot:XP_012654263.1 hypothetical protein TTHERM_000408981 [Tetrahymena thermophila SB210]
MKILQNNYFCQNNNFSSKQYCKYFDKNNSNDQRRKDFLVLIEILHKSKKLILQDIYLFNLLQKTLMFTQFAKYNLSKANRIQFTKINIFNVIIDSYSQNQVIKLI